MAKTDAFALLDATERARLVRKREESTGTADTPLGAACAVAAISGIIAEQGGAFV